MQKCEKIVFGGYTYRRYPQSDKWAEKMYFRRSGGFSLHRAIWEAKNGPAPKGHQIHHKDGNALNNDISNLECIETGKHHRWHGATEKSKEASRRSLNKVRHLAAKWHGSKEGREWHSKHAVKIAKTRPVHQRECEQCHKTYTVWTGLRSRFCSNGCKSKWRRWNRIDDIIANCAVCGKIIQFNKFKKVETCGRSCANRLRARRKRS